MKSTIKNVASAIGIGTFSLFAIASVDDEAVSDGNAATTRSAEAVFNVSAVEIAKEFEKNEVAANLKYENKVGTVTGKIEEIRKDFGIYYITLKGNGAWSLGVDCAFYEDSFAKVLAQLSKGDVITIKGECEGDYGSVSFDNCVIVE